MTHILTNDTLGDPINDLAPRTLVLRLSGSVQNPMTPEQHPVVTETVGGIVVRDAHRWLENDADADVQEWQRRQDRRTVDALAASKHAAAVTAAVRATFEDLHAIAAPMRAGALWFRTVLPEGRSTAVLQVSDHPTQGGRVLVDPTADGATATIGTWAPSPDGRALAVGISEGTLMTFRLVDVASGRTLRELGVHMATAFLAWARDSSGFYHQRFASRDAGNGQLAIEQQFWWQPVEGEAERQPVELGHLLAWPNVSADGGWVAVNVNQSAPRPHWISPVGRHEWKRFLANETAMFKGVFVGDEFWAITDDQSGWGRLVAIPLATGDDRRTWRELLPAQEEVKLASLSRCGDYLALSTFEAGVMQLRTLNVRGEDLGYVPLPGKGSYGRSPLGHIYAILGDIVSADGDGFPFVHSSLDRGPGVYRADLASRTVEELAPPAHVLADRVITSFVAEGRQGPVNTFIVRKASTPLDGSAPVIVFGYGGFNAPEIPHYSAKAAAWTELGGVWVHTQLRGGGERDAAFWHAGRLHRKQGTFDDLYAVLEALYARGYAAPERTGICGTSNGGLLVCAAVTQRPELIRAAVAQVPACDLLQMRKDPTSLNIAKADYGDPDDPVDAPVLHAYSPYHNVRPNTRYPALFCDAGATDYTCPPWHSRKMVAAVQEASTSGLRTLLRVREGAGHNQMNTELMIEREIEELIFFCDELMGPLS